MTPPPLDPNLHLLDSLPLLIWSAGRDARCNYFNRGWLDFTGRTLEEELGDGWTDGIHRGDLNDSLKLYLTAFRAREPFEMEYRLRRHDESYRWVSINGRPVFDESGEFGGFIGYGFDATDGKLADEALKTDHRGLKMLADLSPVAIFHMDAERKVHLVNDRWVRMTGLTAEKSTGDGWLDAIHPADHTRFENELQEAMRSHDETHIECRIVTSSDEEAWVVFQGCPEIDSEGALRGYVGTVTDLTASKQVAEKELQLNKINSLGGLAGQIAHEFNNLLTPIILNLSVAKNQMHQPGLIYELTQRLGEAEEAALRAKTLTQRLLTFGKSSSPVKRTIALRNFVEDAIRFPLKNAKAIPVISFPDDLWPVDVDPNQFNQAIISLVVNAAESMPEGGVLRLSASNHELIDDPRLPRVRGRHVRIQIMDEGIGIEPANLKRIFDPYFSTKSGHSGLGLSTAHSIIDKHSGLLFVDSTPNEGSTFSIYLPASKKEITIEPAVKPRSQAVGDARILIMDDDELVRSSVRAILQSLGYGVETARDGSEALDIYAQSQGEGKPIHLTIMDLTIQGGMGGKEAIAELKALDPEAKAIVCSGHSNDPIMVNFPEYGFEGAIRKPFHPDELGSLLGSLLCA